MYSQHCERVVYRRRYIQNTMRQRKQAKQTNTEIAPSKTINHGIISFLVSSMFIRYVRANRFYVSNKRKQKDREFRVIITCTEKERTSKGSLSPPKPPLNAPSNPSENPTTLLLVLELDGDSRRSRNRNQSRSDRRRHGLTRGSAFLRRRHG
jgi:hypothetical protein